MQFFYTLLLLVASLIQAKGDTCVGTFVEAGCTSLTQATCGGGDGEPFVTYMRVESKGTVFYAQCAFNGATETCLGNTECELPVVD